MSWDTPSNNPMSDMTDMTESNTGSDTIADATSGVQVDTQRNTSDDVASLANAIPPLAINSPSAQPNDGLQVSKHARPSTVAAAQSSVSAPPLPPMNTLPSGNRRATPAKLKHDSCNPKIRQLIQAEIRRRVEQDVSRLADNQPAEDCAENQYTEFWDFVSQLNKLLNEEVVAQRTLYVVKDDASY